MAALELDALTKVYQDGDDRIVAVDDVSMSIDDGEFLVVVGPSGCGKSTTLRMIAGLETVTAGAIRLGGRVVNDVKPQDRDMAMVFQSYALYPHMTVRENMSFGLEESTDMPDDEIRTAVEETATLLGISELLGRRPTELSGGQQQRVALGRAIVRDPDVFLMDEPLSNLDAKLRAQMRTELQRLQENLDTTTIYVTHDQTEAMTMGDRIAILDGGELQQVATPLECYHEPANVFVAGFLGEPSMNFFDVTRRDGRLVADAFEYPVSDELAADLDGQTDLVLGVRPESVELVGSAGGDTDFETTVDVVEPTGDENTVYLTFDGEHATGTGAGTGTGTGATDGETAVEDALVATTGGLRQVRAGQSVVARIPEETVHVFDRSSGVALHNRSLETEELADVRPT